MEKIVQKFQGIQIRKKKEYMKLVGTIARNKEIQCMGFIAKTSA